MDNLLKYYNDYSEGNRLFSSRSRNIEYLTTIKYLDKYITKDHIVADIGCGPGTYTFDLAKRCKKIYSLDIVEKHITEIKKRIESENIKNITCDVGSIEKVNELETETFDIVLCLGPYYHLQNKIERLKFIEACVRILKKGGIIFIGYINSQNAIMYYIKNKMYPTKELYNKLSKDEYLDTKGFDSFLDISYFSKPENVEKEIKQNDIKVINNIGIDGISYFVSDGLSAMNEMQWNDFIQYHLDNCENKATYGMSMHGLLIGIKN